MNNQILYLIYLHAKSKMNQKKGQVWVETAIYMLIGLSIIAIILSVATPQLQKMKEKGIVKQTIEALNSLNKEIIKIENSPGARRIIQFKLTQGKLIINPEHNNITYVLENTGLKLTEPGVEVKEGDLYFLTEEYGKNFNINIELRYNLDITVDGDVKSKTIHGGNYEIQLENVGDNSIDQPVHIDFKIT